MEVFPHYCFLWLTLYILVNFPFIGSPAFIVLMVKWEPLSSTDTFRIPVLEDSYVLGNLLHFPHQPQFCSASGCRPRKRSPAARLPPLSIILVDLYASSLLMEVLKIHFIMFRDGFPLSLQRRTEQISTERLEFFSLSLWNSVVESISRSCTEP